MKRYIVVFLMWWVACVAMAQQTLQIAPLFTKEYPDAYQCQQILLSGRAAASYGLTLFKSIVLQPNESVALDIEQRVVADMKNGNDKEVGRTNGRLYYAFFSVEKPKKLLNAYVYYRNIRNKQEPKNHITLIYMESMADIDQIKKTFKQSYPSK